MKIKLSKIIPSKTNPRKNFDKASMEELTASIKAAGGVTFPITVRRVSITSNVYEIVDGERRFRAAQAAGLKEIDADVKVMTDEEAVEAQLVSFVLRADITPLEEAEAFEKYASEKKNTTNKEIGLVFGKSVQYVALRRQLSKLTSDWKKKISEGKMSIGTAFEIAKLSKEQQQEFFDVVKKNSYNIENEDFVSRLLNEAFFSFSQNRAVRFEESVSGKGHFKRMCRLPHKIDTQH
jgi:ParB family transcriptional regulator, chromosome partitioning protein